MGFGCSDATREQERNNIKVGEERRRGEGEKERREGEKERRRERRREGEKERRREGEKERKVRKVSGRCS
jgi:hypothetical protein